MGWLWTSALNGVLGVGAYLVARFGFRQPAGLTRGLAAAVLGWVWLTLGMEALGAAGWLARGPLLGWVSAGLLIGLACWGVRRRATGPEPASFAKEAGAWSWEEVGAVGLLLWATAVLGPPSLLRPVKVVSDGPIYHLYFAARWWKAGRLDLIAAPFGESAATYFPAVGDLWFTWLMVGWGGDRLAKVGQAPFLALAGLAAVATARRLGAGRAASVVASAWFLASVPLILYAFEPNVDTVFVAGYVLAAYFFLRHALGDDGPAALALGALAAGAALGTKAPGVVFVPPLVALGAGSAFWRGRGTVGTLGGLAAVIFLPFTAAGFWLARDAVLTGNPLYPLHLEAFGRVWLSGWYGPGVMRQSQYYLPVGDVRSLGDIVLAVLDPRLAPVWLAALAGAWAWGGRGRSPLDRWVWVASGLAAANVAVYWLAVPYRTQQRFMLQALGLAAVPLARTFDRARWLRGVGVVLLAVHLLTPQGWPFPGGEPLWDLSPRIPNGSPGLIPLPLEPGAILEGLKHPSTLVPFAVIGGLGLAAFATAWSWGRLAGGWSGRRGARAAALTLGLVGAALAVAAPWGADARHQFFPRFPDYYRGWLVLDLRSGPAGARVAYAGTDLPYYLMGVGLRNEVRYVNVDAHPGWLLHDYHREASARGSRPATWGHPRPGWDRARPDYDAWLANLRAEGIQLLVVTRANPDEGPHNLADAEGFPVERVWADAHPETFEPIYGASEGDRLFRLYRVRNRSESG